MGYDTLEAKVKTASAQLQALGPENKRAAELIKDAKEALEHATGKSIVWGLEQLLKRPAIHDKVNGKDNREKVRNLYNSRVKA